MLFPPVCPEMPVAELAPALAYYRDRLGFTLDWSDAALGLAGLSRGQARLFLADAGFRAEAGNRAPLLLWLNLSGRAEVDALHQEWAARGAIITDPPAARPYRLYEFFARDPDANVFRVFYDFGGEDRADGAPDPAGAR